MLRASGGNLVLGTRAHQGPCTVWPARGVSRTIGWRELCHSRCAFASGMFASCGTHNPGTESGCPSARRRGAQNVVGRLAQDRSRPAGPRGAVRPRNPPPRAARHQEPPPRSGLAITMRRSSAASKLPGSVDALPPYVPSAFANRSLARGCASRPHPRESLREVFLVSDVAQSTNHDNLGFWRTGAVHRLGAIRDGPCPGGHVL